jgi:hypothetical protein
MLPVFAALALACALLDHWTTWLCLRAPIPGWEIQEANPLAAWLFGRVGLVEGLWIDSLITFGAVLLVAGTARLSRPLKLGLLGLLISTSAFAAVNNLEVIQRVGLAAAGAAGG